MSTTAKVKLVGKTPYPTTGDNDQPGDVDQYSLTFTADYDDGRNKEWSKYTPALSLSMSVVPSVAERFSVGDAFVLTFEKEE